MAGRMVMGGDCFTFVSGSQRIVSLDEIVQMLEDGALIVPSKTFNNLKTNIEVLCQYQKNTCKTAANIQKSLNTIKQMEPKTMTLDTLPKYGDRSLDVELLQIALINKGYKIAKDKAFGPQTSAAVIDFKRKNNLYPSNVVGEWVLNLLGLALADKEVEQEIEENDRDQIQHDGNLNIIKHPEFVWQSKGAFNTPNGLPDMLLLHYTVSPKTYAAAKNLVGYFANTPKTLGYQIACPIVDGNGALHVANGWDIWKDRNNNAGSSSWKGRTNISQYALALEICSWGLLDSKTLPLVPPSDRRYSPARDNIKAGTYDKFTVAQEDAIVDAFIAMKRKNPLFKGSSMVVSHDEVAPTRKSDVGASLSKSMPELRAYLDELVIA